MRTVFLIVLLAFLLLSAGCGGGGGGLPTEIAGATPTASLVPGPASTPIPKIYIPPSYATPLPTPEPLGADVQAVVLGNFRRAVELATGDSRPVVAQRAREVLKTLIGESVSWGGRLEGIEVTAEYEVLADAEQRLFVGASPQQILGSYSEEEILNLTVHMGIAIGESGWRSLPDQAKSGMIWLLGEYLERAAGMAMTAREVSSRDIETLSSAFTVAWEETTLGTLAYTLGVLLTWHEPEEGYHPLLQAEILPEDHYSLWDIYRWVFKSQGQPGKAPTKETVESQEWDLHWEFDERGLPRGLWESPQFYWWAMFIKRLYNLPGGEQELTPPPSVGGI